MVYTLNAKFEYETVLTENLRIVSSAHAEDLDGERRILSTIATRMADAEDKIMRLDSGTQNLEKYIDKSAA